MKKQVNSFILFFCVVFSSAQVNVKFIDHLSANNLAREHTTYLNSLPESDSVFYFKAKFAAKYDQGAFIINNYVLSQALCNADTNLNNKASIHFLTAADQRNTQAWFGIPGAFSAGKENNFNTVYKASLNPNLFSEENFPLELQKSYLKYKRSYNKKPVLAAVFSTILPGSGKLYAGKTKTFFLTFLLNAAYAVQTVESGKKLGIKHPLTIINATAFTVFYLSNIYGSYRAVIDLRKERKKQFITDATNFYN
ncbi:MAG: hypothetical protein H0W73_08965 [Bacteroidetes bacterium]|nr:hypothetical protein [Bacteroidota bacterium]